MAFTVDYQFLHIDKEKVSLDRDELLRHLLGDRDEIDAHSSGLASALIKECFDLMEPVGCYVSKAVIPNSSKKDITVREARFQTGGTIVRMLKGAKKIYFFLASAGSGPEHLSRKLIAEGNYLEGYIADLIGSALADAIAQYVHDQIRESCGRSGYRVTNRYSPGYCGWEVEEQHKLFELFPEGNCGIMLSASSLMSPIKSVSGIIGAGPRVSFRDYTCELCSMKDCTFRRTRATEGLLPG